eukprot:726555-Rhodomonas_salina.1
MEGAGGSEATAADLPQLSTQGSAESTLRKKGTAAQNFEAFLRIWLEWSHFKLHGGAARHFEGLNHSGVPEEGVQPSTGQIQECQRALPWGARVPFQAMSVALALMLAVAAAA